MSRIAGIVLHSGDASTSQKTYVSKEVLLWIFFSIFVLFVSDSYGPQIPLDGYQYLSVAKNLSAGHGASTSIIHFDVLYATHLIPAPQTIFPMGYPFLIFLLNKLGLTPEWAGLIISSVGFILLIPTLLWVAKILGFSRNSTSLILMLIIWNVHILHHASCVATESIFTFFFTLSVACSLRAQKEDDFQDAIPFILWSQLFAEFAFFMRYAGLFLVIGLIIHGGIRFFIHRTRDMFKAWALSFVSTTFVAVIFFYNYLVVGSMNGGHDKVVHHSFVSVMYNLVRVIVDIFFAYNTKFILVLCCLGMMIPLLVIFKSIGYRWMKNDMVILPVLVIATYVIFMVYLGMTSIVSFDSTRMFIPLLPISLIVFGIAIKRAEEKIKNHVILYASLMAFVLPSLVSCALSLRDRPPLAQHQEVAFRMSKPMAGNGSVRTWVEKNIFKDEVIMASAGQGTAYALDRKTLSLIESEYSTQVWNENHVRETMELYDARFLFLYPGYTSDSILVQDESEFIKKLLKNEAPSWLALTADNGLVKIYQKQ